MSADDRLLHITDLLLGAAYADNKRTPSEDEAIKKLLSDMMGGKLPAEVAARLDKFAPASFDFAQTIAKFAGDPEEKKHNLLELVAAVRDADGEVDFDEDDYLRKVAKGLGIPDSDVSDLVLDFEVEELGETLEDLRKPPALPKK